MSGDLEPALAPSGLLLERLDDVFEDLPWMIRADTFAPGLPGAVGDWVIC